MPYSSQAKPGSRHKPTGVNEVNTSLESVRTLASARYFDDWSGRGEWPIVIAGRAVSDLRQLSRRDAQMFKIVGKKIKQVDLLFLYAEELSQGFFSKDNHKRLKGPKAGVPIFEAKTTRDMRIVYQIDIDTDIWTQAPRQIIKIYGIFTHAQMDDRLWASVSHYHATHRGEEYRKQCLFRETPRTPGNNVTAPTEFFQQEENETLPDMDLSSGHIMTDEDLQAVRSAVVFEKFALMSKDLVKSMVDDLEGSHVFQVSAHEKEVIYYDSASFVLGRSGTGKTTCIVFKMLGIERMFEEAGEAKPRQVFITQSPALAQKVQEYYNSLIRTYSSRFVAPIHYMSDDKPILTDLRDEGVESFGLPSRYSLLEDKHFPLFLSFDQFCSLLEEDYISDFGHSTRFQATNEEFEPDSIFEIDEESEADQTYIDEQLRPAVWTMESIKKNKHAAVTFDVFSRAYWPLFDRRLTYDLDPALVFNEFIGIIEGSEFAADSKSGVLSRDGYLEVGRKTSLLTSRRDTIYTLYENYCNIRDQFGGYDAAERTHALLIATQNGKRVPGPKIDALYIDEVQDNLMIDSKLLCNLSDNPHGILMAGDTAQTISAGSSFRFEDLKAFFWRLEDQNKAVRAKKRKAIQPELFHLSINYRSHSGIVNCASALVELVSELFPKSIDKLKRETGLIEGPKPVFFSGWERDSIQTDLFFRDEGNVKIDFGANQVILVRDNNAREALRARVGDIGLILTLFESKGLEFNDVLLYNFFEDSNASAATWRVVLPGRDRDKYRSLTQFDAVRYAVICTELKNLYFGLTRARNHCWIWDASEKAEPMKEFWIERKLIDQCRPGDPIPKLSESSSKSEWEAQGRALFERQLFPQAVLCFQRAGLALERDIAAAYEARKQARLLQATKANNHGARVAFRHAADKFMECSKIAIPKQQRSCYIRAADCFVQAEEWELAAETFILARDFSMAAKSFRNAGCFAEAMEIIKAYPEHIPENIAEEIRKVTRLQYLRTNKFDQVKELFNGVNEQLDYMKDCGLESGRVRFLKQHQRDEEAAEAEANSAFRVGDIIKGIHLLQASKEPKLLRQAIEKALGALWILYPLSRHEVDMVNPAADILIRSLINEPKLLSEDETHQLEVFRAIREDELSRIVSLARSHGILASDTKYRLALSLICFPRTFNSLIPSKEWTLQHFINTSKSTRKYVSQLFLFARTLDISELWTQRLLGVEPADHLSPAEADEGSIVSPRFRIFSTSPLFSYSQQSEVPSQGGSIFTSVLGLGFTTANESNTREFALNALYCMLRTEISKVHEAASSEFQPLYSCLEFAVFGNCGRSGCRRQHVDSLKAPEAERQLNYNLRAQALMVQMEIVDKYHTSERLHEAERRRIRRIWAHKMHETLMPLFPPLGGFHYMEKTLIPELKNGKNLISIWSQQVLFELDPRYGAEERFLSDALVSLDFAWNFDKDFAIYVDSLHSSRLVKARRDLMTNKPRFPSDRSSRSIVHDFVNFYRRKSDDALRRVITASQHIVSNNLTIEVNLLAHLLELIGREIIVHHRACNRGKYGVFDGLVVPHSWALDLAKRRPLTAQRGFGFPELMEYLGTLYKTLENLREFSIKPSCLYSFSGRGTLNTLARGILILRICRLIVLVAENTDFTPRMKEDVRLNISRVLAGPGELHRGMCDRIIQNKSWIGLQGIILRCPLNRGTDRLVRLFLKNDRYSQPPPNDFIRLIVYNNVPELEQLLSFTCSAHQPQTTLNPQAQPFNPLHPSQPLSNNQTSTSKPENYLETEDAGDTMDLMGSGDPTQFGPLAESHPELTRKLTANEIKAGRRILFAYREYIIRRHTSRTLAVATIWRCYSLYRHRRDAPRSAADERYLKFQRDYIKDIKVPDGLGPIPKSFYRRKAILLGCMPHIAVYLRGLEHTNQLQKHANRKRLQIAHHKELEEIESRMNACSEFARVLKRLISAVMPGSQGLQDLRALRTQMKELERLYKEMEKEFGRDLMPTFLEHHRRWGVAIILAQPA